MDIKIFYNQPEIWGGLECTINRVNDKFRDQLEYTGHYERKDDIAKFGSLGIKALRYPLLWARHEPKQNIDIDWSWANEQLSAIRKQNIIPIAGLVHHGSGPAFTNLYCDSFAKGLQLYAEKVAREFPWIEYYTPVNEPLTTARFSGLYGFWYPHHKSDNSFVTILLNQIKAVVLAMQAIRKINPAAKLVQTEDLSKVYTTPSLQYQANFENERRWITYDLLCGKVNEKHTLWNYFIHAGIRKEQLYFFLDNVCFPDIAGFNYYVTSERYFDRRLKHYAPCCYGGNGSNVYADVEAVRVPLKSASGLKHLLIEAWERFGLPMAITEAHINCTREEQMRWFYYVWNTCKKLNKKGIDIKAVTSWSLLGAQDWNSLLTQINGCYEPGVFDVSNNSIRPTALTKLISSLAKNGKFGHPLLNQKGWWQRNDRFIKPSSKKRMVKAEKLSSPLLVIGKNGTLATAFRRICEQRNISHKALGRNEIDILDVQNIESVIRLYKPWAVINTAGYVKVDDAEREKDICNSLNAVAPAILAKVCNTLNLPFMTFSSDLVFGGEKNVPYIELDKVNPLNVYGFSKAEGEIAVARQNPSALIIRTSSFFGPWDKANFAYHVSVCMQQNRIFEAADDVIISPTYVPDLVNTALNLFIDEEKGIWHVTNDGYMSWAQFAIEVAKQMCCNRSLIISKSKNNMGWHANRPDYSVLQSERGIKLPAFDTALNRFFKEQEVF